MQHTGGAPGRGSYTCNSCGTVLHLDEDRDRLPPCPECFTTKFEEN
ncbi:MAG: hypothetical protein Q8906_11205 [Bacillota bacterium]|nr:hypothetical protein [Bacillota bacterium]